MNNKNEFKKKLYNQSKTLPLEFNSNLQLKKQKKSYITIFQMPIWFLKILLLTILNY